MKKVIIVLLLLLLSAGLTYGKDFDFSKIKNRVSEFTLDNGLKFILLEDHSIPIASFVTYVNVGGVDEKIGYWGISHFLEHMAFKGTTEIGTKNWPKEKKLFVKMDSIFSQILNEEDKRNSDKKKIEGLKKKLDVLKKEAAKLVIPNEFNTLLKKNGCVGLNAGTGADNTSYYLSLPSNKLELWAYLESARYLDPAFREFYKERDVITEERRMRVENQPIGKLIEETLGLAFKVHPYKINIIGPMSNIKHFSRKNLKEYFKQNYTAKNMVIGVTGDVTPKQLKKLAKKYFSKIKAGKKSPWLYTFEPKQAGEKRMTIYDDSQPFLLMAYHCPAGDHPDFTKFGLLNYILTNGRSSRLNKKMVIKDKSALAVFSMGGFPGSKYPNLYMMIAVANKDIKSKKLIDTISDEVKDLKNNLVSDEELKSAKIRMKLNAVRTLGSNRGLLNTMLSAEVLTGSWENVFSNIAEIDKITTEDIKTLANKYFTVNNRIITKIEKKIKKKKEEVKKTKGDKK